jgi:hypothetical protein
MSSDTTIRCLSPTSDIAPGDQVRATIANLQIDGIVRARQSGRLLIEFRTGVYLEVSPSCVERLEASDVNDHGKSRRKKQDPSELLTV